MNFTKKDYIIFFAAYICIGIAGFILCLLLSNLINPLDISPIFVWILSWILIFIFDKYIFKKIPYKDITYYADEWRYIISSLTLIVLIILYYFIF